MPDANINHCRILGNYFAIMGSTICGWVKKWLSFQVNTLFLKV